MLTGLAHTGICVPDVEAACRWYAEVLGLTVLSPPYLMAGPEIERDMGELLGSPRMKAAILGLPDSGDRVLELIEYPDEPGSSVRGSLADHGLSHVALLCDDVVATRAELEAKGVTMLVSGVADVARLRTTWFVDPWGVTFILIEKSRPDRPYWGQWSR